MNRYHLLEHTADIGIAADADSRAGLAAQSGEGLKFLLFGPTTVIEQTMQTVSSAGNSPEETLVNWLNELLYLMEEKQLVPARIGVDRFTDNRITGTISGEPFDPERHRMLREIKAVTHHQASVTKKEEHWSSVVYLDL